MGLTACIKTREEKRQEADSKIRELNSIASELGTLGITVSVKPGNEEFSRQVAHIRLMTMSENELTYVSNRLTQYANLGQEVLNAINREKFRHSDQQQIERAVANAHLLNEQALAMRLRKVEARMKAERERTEAAQDARLEQCDATSKSEVTSDDETQKITFIQGQIAKETWDNHPATAKPLVDETFKAENKAKVKRSATQICWRYRPSQTNNGQPDGAAPCVQYSCNLIEAKAAGQ